MPCFQFHLVEHETVVTDFHGRDLLDVEAAIGHARSLAAVYAHGRPLETTETEETWLQIASDRGEPICLSLHGLLTWSSEQVARFGAHGVLGRSGRKTTAE